MAIDLILGTAGHIDHGKTSLVRALTGVDTDRLPEEKRRGITIELGFAHLELGDVRLGIVDVPGHEKFVRNMLTGATSIDVALLVVAADDSVKPQTLEHLEILRLLRLQHGVIAITKVDLSDPTWLELVEEEVRRVTADTFLARAPIIGTSVMTGQGLEELKQALRTAALAAAEDRRGLEQAPFRLAIDRTFTVAGHGTVVTGSVTSGTARVGDELMIEPGHLSVRVRGLQNHDVPVEAVHRGQRAAINLAGVNHDQIRRGQELCQPGHLVPSRLLTVRLQVLPHVTRALKNRHRVRLHVGTADIPAFVSLLDRDELAPGETAPVQLFLREPAVTTWGQAFVLRQESPASTIGGGQVLDPNASKLRRREAAKIARLADLWSPDGVVRAGAALYLAGLRGWEPSELTRTAGVSDAEAAAKALVVSGELREFAISPTRKLRVSRQALEEVYARFEEVLARMHKQNPLLAMLDVSKFLHRVRYMGPPSLLETLLAAMQQAGRVIRVGQGISLKGHGPQLTKAEQKMIEEIIAIYQQAGLQPPTVEEVKARFQKNQGLVPQLTSLAASLGHLVQVAPGMYLHEEVERQMRGTLEEKLRGSPGLTVSEIKDVLRISRKYAVPYCEHLDKAGFTRRVGDLRVLASEAPPS